LSLTCLISLTHNIFSSNEARQPQAVDSIQSFMRTDRYFSKAMGDVLTDAFVNDDRFDIGVHVAQIARQIYDCVVTDHLYRLRYRSGSPVDLNIFGKKYIFYRPHYIYRHRSTANGRIHVRKGQPFSPAFPCNACLELGNWEDWLDGTAVCEQLYCIDSDQVDRERYDYYGELLFLYHADGEVFDTSEHIPLMVGVNDLGEKEYLTYLGVDLDYLDDFATITHGATHASMPPSHRKHFEFEWARRREEGDYVLVLRFDPSDQMEAFIRADGGVDSTGPFYWKACLLAAEEDVGQTDDAEMEWWIRMMQRWNERGVKLKFFGRESSIPTM